mmetsp:Transcript_21485/g.47750  ORF Transcript_21485/g.47750 Transcript_21485/m.47750 type:complete len:216 (+) Transcript_21485:3-650(+)
MTWLREHARGRLWLVAARVDRITEPCHPMRHQWRRRQSSRMTRPSLGSNGRRSSPTPRSSRPTSTASASRPLFRWARSLDSTRISLRSFPSRSSAQSSASSVSSPRPSLICSTTDRPTITTVSTSTCTSPALSTTRAGSSLVSTPCSTRLWSAWTRTRSWGGSTADVSGRPRTRGARSSKMTMTSREHTGQTRPRGSHGRSTATRARFVTTSSPM